MQGLALKFRLFGFPISIDPSFLFLVAFLWISNIQNPGWGLEIAMWILISVMVHELGHAVAGRAFGLEPSIRMTFMGGLTSWSSNSGKTPGNLQHIIISFAGPFAGFAFGGLIFLFWKTTGVWTNLALSPEDAILYLMYMNFGWGLLNLIPLYPLDGGQVVYYLLRTNDKIPANRVSAIVSLAIGAGLILWAVLEQQYWIAFILGWILAVNINRLKENVQDSPRLQELAREIQGHLTNGSNLEGLKAAGELLALAKVESIRSWASEMSALFLDLINDDAQTLSFTHEFHKYLSESAALRFLKMKARGEHTEANGFATRSLKTRPSQALVTVYLGHLIQTGKSDQVPGILQRFQQARWFPVTGTQLQLRLIQAEAYLESIRVGESVLEPEGRPIIAYNLACAHARLGQAREALRWLTESVRRGFNSKNQMAADDDLVLLHDYPAFQELMDQM
ncbi:MAG TPA: hypothetical protein ENJ82_17370 [Bacteroidetes bacterium]|nr:hypothetical protein [Bacteroidota bacterium]